MSTHEPFPNLPRTRPGAEEYIRECSNRACGKGGAFRPDALKSSSALGDYRPFVKSTPGTEKSESSGRSAYHDHERLSESLAASRMLEPSSGADAVAVQVAPDSNFVST